MRNANTDSISVRNAYLLPLLKLHDRGETVLYEDLFSSYDSGKLVLNSLNVSKWLVYLKKC